MDKSDLLLGYVTNGLSEVDAVQSIDLLHAIGYRSIGFTLDTGLLNPFAANWHGEVERTRDRLEHYGMRCVIETGARFLLNPQLKHEPTLVSPDEAGRVRRIDFLRQAIDLAAAFDAECVSIWSGRIHDGAGDVEAMRRLVMGLTEVLHYAGTKDVLLAFEPEPGMFIDTMASYVKLVEELAAARADTSPLRLTIDVGHLHCQGEVPIARQLHTWRNQLVNIHIEDMRRGVHEHLMFGEGEIDFPPILATLREIEFKGPVSVELSRHAHIGPQAARQAYDFLTATV